ncbi:MAG: hypothetical protein ABW164_01730 [Sphingobium sp.]
MQKREGRIAAAGAGLIAALMALSACVTLSPEARLRARLIEAGLSPRTAQCMAIRMADDLSLLQLRRIESVASMRGEDVRGMSIDRLLYRLRALNDPDIFLTASSAAIGCAVRNAL